MKEIIGDQTLYLGDCLEVLASLPAESIDMIWTDPPYGHNNADGDLLERVNGGAFKGRKKLQDGLGAKPILNDGMDDMKRVVDGMLGQAARLLKKDASCCCCCGGGGPQPTFAWLANRMDAEGLSFFHSVIWDKLNPGLGWRYKRQHEMIMISHRKGGKLKWSEDARPVGNIIQGFFPGQQRAHPNEKPGFLIDGFIQRHTEVGDVVLDPFAGSFSTAVSCIRLGRKSISVELDPEHFYKACERVHKAWCEPRLELPAPPKAEQTSFL